MRTLIYKRTHHGDPDEDGRFGINGCMGRVRAREFQAVIGIGGIGPEPRSNGIAGKITWVGIGPRRVGWKKNGPILVFERFLYYGAKGPQFADYAPELSKHIYRNNVRVKMVAADDSDEVRRILALARKARPSRKRGEAAAREPECRPRKPAKPPRGCSRKARSEPSHPTGGRTYGST